MFEEDYFPFFFFGVFLEFKTDFWHSIAEVIFVLQSAKAT